MGKRWRKCVDCFPSTFVQFFVVSKLHEPQKIERSDRTRRRFGAVVVILHSQDDARVFATGRKVTAVFLIKEQTVLCFLKLERELQPFDVERGFVEIEKSLNDECVI